MPKNIAIFKASKTGIGDRLRGVLATVLYAELTQRNVFIDWRDGLYGEVGDNIFYKFFKLKKHEITNNKNIDSIDDVEPAAWRGRLSKSLADIYIEDGNLPWDRTDALSKYAIDLGNLDYKNQAVVNWEFTQLNKLKPYLPDPKRALNNEKLESEIWNEYLDFHEDINEEIKFFINEMNGPTLGVHIRATEEFYADKGLIHISQYFKAIDKLLKSQPINSIFVACDNSAILEAVKSRYPLVVSREKWFPEPGQPIHLSNNSQDREKISRDAVIELGILSKCNWLISIENSSFSIVARIASKADNKSNIILRPEISIGTRIKSKLASIFIK